MGLVIDIHMYNTHSESSHGSSEIGAVRDVTLRKHPQGFS